MKRLITILLVFLSVLTFGQDKEMFSYINTYRVKNGINKLKWSKKLYVITKRHNDDMIKNDSLYHSYTNTYENVAGGPVWDTPITPKGLNDFNKFLKRYYNMTFDPTNVTDINMYIKLHVIYAWDNSIGHKKNLLRKNIKYGSVEIFIGDFTYYDNKKTINGVVVTFDKMITTYKGRVFSTMNLIN